MRLPIYELRITNYDLDFSALRAGMRSGIYETRECVVRKVCFYVLTLRYRTTSALFGQKLRFCPIPLRALGGFAFFPVCFLHPEETHGEWID